MNTQHNPLSTTRAANPAPLSRMFAESRTWVARHLGTALATTLIFVSSTSVYSLLEAFH